MVSFHLELPRGHVVTSECWFGFRETAQTCTSFIKEIAIFRLVNYYSSASVQKTCENFRKSLLFSKGFFCQRTVSRLEGIGFEKHWKLDAHLTNATDCCSFIMFSDHTIIFSHFFCFHMFSYLSVQAGIVRHFLCTLFHRSTDQITEAPTNFPTVYNESVCPHMLDYDASTCINHNP